MSKLLRLEWKRGELRTFHIALIIITISMSGMLYLFTAIPWLDPMETDIELFSSYRFLLQFHSLLCMDVFAILSAVLYSKIVIEEYAGKQTILLFLYPVERTKLLDIKLGFVFLYTIGSMIISNIFIYTVFFLTESVFPICSDTLTIPIIINCLVTLCCNSIIAGLLGIISLWMGFYKKSISATIIASIIIVSVVSQFLAISFRSSFVTMIFLFASLFLALLARKSLHVQVNRMEV